MKNNTLAKFARNTRLTLSKHSPAILIGIGITGMITTTALAVKATPKALQLIEMRKEELEVDSLPPVEVVKTTWKCYIPAAISCVAAGACFIGSHSVHARRHAALATAYKLSETAFTEYREKVIETIGEKKERAVRDKVSEEQIKNTPLTRSEVIVTGRGQTLFLEPLSHRYFYSDIEKINKAVNKLNHDIITDPFDAGVCLNDFYDEIGLPPTMTGDTIGWKLAGGLIEIYPSPHMAEEGTEYEGQPCLVMNYKHPPRYDFL